jgi:hypothetical protein
MNKRYGPRVVLIPSRQKYYMVSLLPTLLSRSNAAKEHRRKALEEVRAAGYSFDKCEGFTSEAAAQRCADDILKATGHKMQVYEYINL